MKNKTQGFTLIELLIVIAIIGILAAVLIPQLLGARIAANKRAVQAHSSTVYKAGLAIMAEDPTATATAVSAALELACKVSNKSSISVTVASVTTVYKYGWGAVPSPVNETDGACTVTPSGPDIVVKVTGGESADKNSSTNGAQPKL